MKDYSYWKDYICANWSAQNGKRLASGSNSSYWIAGVSIFLLFIVRSMLHW